jgi:plastocyanin
MYLQMPSRVRGVAAALALSTALLSSSVASAQEVGAAVAMETLSFAPIEIHVTPGTSLQWTNGSVLGHTVTSDDGWFDSGLVNPGESFIMTFDTPGVYQYYCAPHGSPGLNGMAGVVIVDDPAAATEVVAPAPEPAPVLLPPPGNPTTPPEEEYVPDH